MRLLRSVVVTAVVLTAIANAGVGGVAGAYAQNFRVVPRRALDSVANPVAAADSPMKFASTRADLGTVSEDGESVERIFRWRNCGDEPIVVREVRTGCGCVVARYDKRPVMPGDEGEIALSFRPKGHPGWLLRKIAVYAGMETQPAAVLELTGHVAPSAVPAHRYRYGFGPLRLKQRQVRIEGTRRATESIEVLNAGDTELRITADTTLLPRYVQVRCLPERIAAGANADIEISFDPAAVENGKTGEAYGVAAVGGPDGIEAAVGRRPDGIEAAGVLPDSLPIVLQGLALPPEERTIWVLFGAED